MVINYENLKLHIPYDIVNIQRLYFIAEINNHHLLNIDVIIENENVSKYLNERIEGKVVNILNQDDTPIFIGKIIGLEIEYIRQVSYLKLKCSSYSHDLDIKRSSHAYINLAQTYKNIILETISKYNKSSFKDNVTNDKASNQLILQYKETDWAFIKRLATHFNTVLIVDSSSELIRFHFGIDKEAKQLKLVNNIKKVVKHMSDYNYFRNNIDVEAIEQEFIEWNFDSNEYFALGSKFKYKEQSIYITKVEMRIIKGQLIYKYTLKCEKGISTKYFINNELRGVTLSGIVKKVQNNEMQLQFLINESYEENENNKWFCHSEEIGNFYCMPVLGSKVNIMFLTGNEGDSIVSDSVRIAKEKDKYYSKILEPNNKSYSTVDGQELFIDPNMIRFSENDGKTIQVMLQKNGTISITGINISINASNYLHLGDKQTSDKKVLKPNSITISAKNGITITRSSTNSVNVAESIQLNEDNHIRGSLIKLGK